MSSSSLRAALPAVAAAVAALLLPAAATRAAPGEGGEPGERSQGEALFETARALMKQGRTDEACATYAASLRAYASIGARLNVARCHELGGRTASAWREYNRAAGMARAAGQAGREAAARKLAAAIEPKLSTLAVQPAAAAAGLKILRDGEELAAAAVGVPEPLDPGEHRIEARAPGRLPWSTAVTLAPQADHQTLIVPSSGTPAANPAPAADSAAPAGSGQRVAGFVVGGVGLAAAVTGAVLGAVVLYEIDKAKSDPALCADKQCTPTGRAYVDAVSDKGTAATVLIGAGAAVAVAGIVVILTAPAEAGEQAAGQSGLRLRAALGPGGGGVALGGRF
ncbi:MAG: hypothetical protein HY744_29735 [Deltaproteobacteria bacterium]|nr:hypothetical protein [Deltaproteobacteria bacterium]